MSEVDQKEIQKTLEQMNQRVQNFSSGDYSSSEFDSSSNSKLKLILTIIGVIIILITSVYFYIKSGGKNGKKPPVIPGMIYPIKIK